jgi:hypothetical protein
MITNRGKMMIVNWVISRNIALKKIVNEKRIPASVRFGGY